MTSRLTNTFKKTLLIPFSLLLFILIFTPLGIAYFFVNKLKRRSNEKTFWKTRTQNVNSMKKQY